MGFLQGLTGWHFLAVLVIVLLLFGATRLPALSKSLGQSIKIFRREMKPEDEGRTDATSADGTASPTAEKPAATTPHDKP